jgi:hypothetical protein
LAIVEFELAWAPHLLSTMGKPAPDYDPGIAGGNTARVYNFDAAKLSAPA